MNLFQWLTIPAITALFFWDMKRLLGQETGRRRWRLLRMAICSLAIVAILRPDATSLLAHTLGIGRGTDLLVYLLALLFLASSFFWYTRTLQLERQITSLTRHVAIQEASHGSAPPKQEMPPCQ